MEAAPSKTATLLIPFVGKTKLFKPLTYKSSVASDRLQIRPLLKALEDLNFDVTALSLNINHSLEELELIKPTDLCIVSKIRAHPEVDEEKFTYFHTCCVLKMKRLGAKILTIYSDNVCNAQNTDGELYRSLLFLSDTIVTPSKKLSAYANTHANPTSTIFTISDPNQLKKQQFRRIEKNQPIKLIWFGNFSNLKYLKKALGSLTKKLTLFKNINLQIVTSMPGIEYMKKELTPFSIRSNWTIELIEWDIKDQPRQLESLLNASHIALIPSDPNDPTKDGVSHNRLVDSIQSGCISIASPVDSYCELSKIALIGNNFSDLINKAILENNRLCAKYEVLRDEQLRRFNPAVIHSAWTQAIKQSFS